MSLPFQRVDSDSDGSWYDVPYHVDVYMYIYMYTRVKVDGTVTLYWFI